VSGATKVRPEEWEEIRIYREPGDNFLLGSFRDYSIFKSVF
jgi:hypothetical protein